jgi:hypothetical protein
MTAPRISALCHHCGRVELTLGQIRLMVCNNVASRSYCSFACPNCRREVRKPVSRDMINLLVSATVVAVTWHIPDEALEEHTGPPLVPDDELDFALALQEVVFVAALAAPREKQ